MAKHIEWSNFATETWNQINMRLTLPLCFAFVLTLTVFRCGESADYQRLLQVASHDASPAAKAAADFVCTGKHDEAIINEAISKLSATLERELVPAKSMRLDLSPSTAWRPVDAGTRVRRESQAVGSSTLCVHGNDIPYPGVALDGKAFNLEAYECLELVMHSPSAIKVRVTLRDRNQQELRFHEKLPSPDQWHRLRFYLNQPYAGKANLTDITSIQIQATTELNDCEFSIAKACFTSGVKLEHARLHPGSIEIVRGQSKLKLGVDFEADLEQGVLWIDDPAPVQVRYRYGGGSIKLLPGEFHIDGPSGIELRSYCELDLQGATLLAARTYETKGLLMQTLPDSTHTHISIRGGQLRGQRMRWTPQQTISGIVIRDASHVTVSGCEIVDFNSVGLAVVQTGLGASQRWTPQRVTITDNRIARCATEYVDIRGDLYGEVGKGAEHKAMLRLAGVSGFEIRGNRIEDSFGDAKWVVDCEDGLITGNTIDNSRMGSYFVERSVRVIGTSNMIRNSGSRAVTIERGSHANIFANNVILNSYREGLWLMGCSECLIQGNRFENNGWRNSKDLDSAIKVEWQKQFAKDQANFNRITQNIIKTQPHQDQGIWIASGENSRGNTVSDNLILGTKVPVRDEGLESIIERNRTGD
jgi:parallel beta-helix repeat protein